MSRIHNPFDRACRAVLLSPALFGLVEGLRLSIGPVQSLLWSHPRTYRVHDYARLHWAQGSRGTQLPIEPGKHLSCPLRRKLATCNCDGRHSILVLTQPKLLNILLTD